MNDLIGKISGALGMFLVSAFLLGLAESIGELPFWVIVFLVLGMGWTAFYDEAIKKTREKK